MSEATASETVRLSGSEEQPIPEGAFPVPCCSADLRVWMSPDTHGLIAEHARSDTRIELCGVLVGQVLRDSRGPFLVIEDIIRGKDADNDPARVTFTQETWTYIFSELDSKHPSKRIVGWYHTHPGFGVFLSPMDTFIQDNFFNLSWQVAFVIDPLSGDEGLFHWRDGKIVRSFSYWTGDIFRSAKARSSAGAGELPIGSRGEGQEQPVPARIEPDPRPRPRHLAWNLANIILLVLILLAVLFQPLVQRVMQRLLAWFP